MRKLNAAENTGLVFFGRMSASISHEIKNTLAIINENAGLLEDLTLLAEKGATLSGERLRRLSHVIKNQVNRADNIVKKMNRFSHSIDETVQPVDLYDTVIFVMDMCDRLLSLHNTRVTVTPPEIPVVVSSSLFHLEHLIWACVEYVMLAGGSGEPIVITIEKLTSGASIKLNTPGRSLTSPQEVPAPGAEQTLQQVLDADIRLDSENGEMLILLPQTID